MIQNSDWADGEYTLIQRALMEYGIRTTEVVGKGNSMRCLPNSVLEYAVKRFGEGAREEEIKAILLYGQSSY